MLLLYSSSRSYTLSAVRSRQQERCTRVLYIGQLACTRSCAPAAASGEGAIENELPADCEQQPPGVVGAGLEIADLLAATNLG
eukprot:COSAG01_NODE_741_length_13888_cov_119.430996_17_plen_82_part_01